MCSLVSPAPRLQRRMLRCTKQGWSIVLQITCTCYMFPARRLLGEAALPLPCMHHRSRFPSPFPAPITVPTSLIPPRRGLEYKSMQEDSIAFNSQHVSRSATVQTLPKHKLELDLRKGARCIRGASTLELKTRSSLCNDMRSKSTNHSHTHTRTELSCEPEHRWEMSRPPSPAPQPETRGYQWAHGLAASPTDPCTCDQSLASSGMALPIRVLPKPINKRASMGSAEAMLEVDRH